MTDITAKIVADSVNRYGDRLTTMQLRYPRFIHAESKTHRQIVEHGPYLDEGVIYAEDYGVPTGLMYDPAFSRNARSSRAVPVETMLKEVMENPVIPIHWGAAQKGMQAYNETNAMIDIGHVLGGFPQPVEATNEQAWLIGRDMMVKLAEAFHKAGYAKQVINRLLEPWLHIDTLVSATEWTNFLGLRDHYMAEPHIEKLAKEIKVVMAASTPTLLQPGEWHLPYVTSGTDDAVSIVEWAMAKGEDPYDVAKKISVARCARISYKPFDGNATIEAELNRYDLLVGSAPLHASPAEHMATPDTKSGEQWASPQLHGNFKGWIQFRKTLPNECIAEAA